MSDDFRKQIYNNLKLKETDELMEIWKINDRVERSELAFDVIREILQQRLGEIPPQGEPVYEHVEQDADMEKPVSKEWSKLQNENVRERRAASYKLSKSNDARAVPGLIKAYQDADSSVRQNGIDGLRRIGSKEALDFLSSQGIPSDLLLTELQNGNLQQRRAASYKLSKSNDTRAVPGLIKACQDADSFVRQKAIDGLRRIGSKEALDFLISQGISCEEDSHSKWGILSFLVSLVMLVMIVPVYMFSGTPLPEEVLSIPLQYFILFLYCILPAGCLLGVSLAIAGFREKNRKNLFSGLGLIMNVLASLLMLLFWMLALMVGFPLSLWFH